MRVLFVHDLPETESLGVAAIMGALKYHHHEAGVLIAGAEKDFLKAIKEFNPDILAFSLVRWGRKPLLRIGRYLKRAFPQVLTIVGGPFVATKHSVVHESWIDYATFGEGEFLMVELCEAIEGRRAFEDVAGLVFKRKGKTVFNKPRMLVDPLDDLPLPDRTPYYSKYAFLRNLSVKRFVTGRGCPFSCTFCFNSALREQTKGLGKYTRKNSPHRMIQEILSIQSIANLKHIHFSDDVFFFDRDWLEEFLSLYRQDIHIPFSCNLSPMQIDKEVVRKIAEGGCVGVGVGLETGNEKFRVEMLNKPKPDNYFVELALWLKECGIKLLTYNMVGLPGETLESAIETLLFNRKIGADFVQCTIAVPFDGVPLTEYALSKNLLVGTVNTGDGSYDDLDKDYPNFRCEKPDAMVNLRYLFPILNRFGLTPETVTYLTGMRIPRKALSFLYNVALLSEARSYYKIDLLSGLEMFFRIIYARKKWRQIEREYLSAPN